MHIAGKTIELVIFDMDGLMFDTERLAGISWDQALTRCGYAFHNEVFLETVGLNSKMTKDIYLKFYGDDFPFDEMLLKRKEIFDKIIETQGVPVKEGLKELLKYLDSMKIKKAVATSTGKIRAEILLSKGGIKGCFDLIICGDEITKGKPDPEIFLKAAGKLDIDAGNCAVLEDSENGIAAAYNAGMIPLMVPDIKEPGAEIRNKAYKIFKNLKEARYYFENADREKSPDM